ncbi:hypothetical protein FACS1894126_6060 [Alphaproteobacteria bacterium]|nr:hypothetical protein FACS1894126_6060 [Alphaproteobacteria bacterium]
MNSVLYSALQERGLPFPKEDVTSDKFTRWGKKFRYWAIKFVGGYSFGGACSTCANGFATELKCMRVLIAKSNGLLDMTVLSRIVTSSRS